MKKKIASLTMVLLILFSVTSTMQIKVTNNDNNVVPDSPIKKEVLGLGIEQATSLEQSTADWNKTYGGGFEDRAWSLVETSDGGYALVGYTESLGEGASDAWLIKVDSNGDEQWNRTYGGQFEDWLYSLVETGDGGYAMAGATQSLGEGDRDGWLIKVDSNGDEQWNRTYGGVGPDYVTSLVETSDGGYAMAGGTQSFGEGNYDAWLIKQMYLERQLIEIEGTESKPWSLLKIPFEDMDDARDYVVNFVIKGTPETDFGTIPMNITIANTGTEPAENVEIDADITGVAALASLDEDNVKNDYVYLHPFDYRNSYTVGAIDAMSTKKVAIEIPVKYAHVFTGVFKYNKEDEAEILFIATELKVELEIRGTNTNKIQESTTLTGVANPLDLAAYTIVGVLERLKDKMTDEVYQELAEYVYVLSGGMTTTNFQITTDTHIINTQIEPGTTSFSISAFIPDGMSLVELSITIGTFTFGIISTAVYGFAFLIIKPPDLRYGDAQITIKTTEATALVLVMRDSFKSFNLTTISILSENIHFDHTITFENKSYNLHFNTNCTLFDINFNDTKKMVSFEIAGQESSVGFCNVTIPKELLRANATHPWKVRLNETDNSFASTENATHSSIYFDVVDGGVYTIEITGSEAIPEFPPWMISPLLITVALLATILRKKTYIKNPQIYSEQKSVLSYVENKVNNARSIS